MDSGVTETAFIFNSFLFLSCGFLALFLLAGFSLLERRPNDALARNLLILCVTTLAFWVAGYQIMYGQLTKSWWQHLLWRPDDTTALLRGSFDSGYASSADWFFQMLFAAVCVWIISTALSARVALAPLLIFSVVLAGVMYPVIGSWQWGEGWLSRRGFYDFAGASLVHALGGWCVLTALLLLPSTKKYTPGPLFPAGIALVWTGILALHGGAQLALGSAADSVAISNIIVNSHLAACGGIVGAWIASNMMRLKKTHSIMLYGAMAGLVSVAAEPLTPSPLLAIAIGFCGGVVMLLALKGLQKYNLDSTGMAIPIHLGCGTWGTLAVLFTNPSATLAGQLTGILTVAVAGVTASSLLWLLLGFAFKAKKAA